LPNIIQKGRKNKMTTRAQSLKRNSKVRRQGDPVPWKYCLLTMVCGLLLVSGFFWAARQHFCSIDYGMKNAKLRNQLEELKSEKRRYQLSREIALTPGEIKRAAKKLGLERMTARNIEVVKPKDTKETKAITINNSDFKNETRTYVSKSDTKTEKAREKKSRLEVERKTNKKGEKIASKKSDKWPTKSKNDNKSKDDKSRTQLARR